MKKVLTSILTDGLLLAGGTQVKADTLSNTHSSNAKAHLYSGGNCLRGNILQYSHRNSCANEFEWAGDDIDSAIQKNLQLIQTENTRIDSVESSITTNSSAISANDNDIATNVSSITTNTSSILSNDTDISSLQTLVKSSGSGTTVLGMRMQLVMF